MCISKMRDGPVVSSSPIVFDLKPASQHFRLNLRSRDHTERPLISRTPESDLRYKLRTASALCNLSCKPRCASPRKRCWLPIDRATRPPSLRRTETFQCLLFCITFDSSHLHFAWKSAICQPRQLELRKTECRQPGLREQRNAATCSKREVCLFLRYATKKSITRPMGQPVNFFLKERIRDMRLTQKTL